MRNQGIRERNILKFPLVSENSPQQRSKANLTIHNHYSAIILIFNLPSKTVRLVCHNIFCPDFEHVKCSNKKLIQYTQFQNIFFTDGKGYYVHRDLLKSSIIKQYNSDRTIIIDYLGTN